MPFMWRRASRNTDVQDAKTANRRRILDDDAFDDLARAIASGTTRRDSLKLLLVGITSAGLGAGLMENSSQGHAASTRRGPNQVENPGDSNRKLQHPHHHRSLLPSDHGLQPAGILRGNPPTRI